MVFIVAVAQPLRTLKLQIVGMMVFIVAVAQPLIIAIPVVTQIMGFMSLNQVSLPIAQPITIRVAATILAPTALSSSTALRWITLKKVCTS